MAKNLDPHHSLDPIAYEHLVQSVVDYAIYMVDLEGRVSSWNAGAERAYGDLASEIIGAHFSRFYTPEDRAAGVPEQALKAAAEEGRFETEGWQVRKDGSHFWAMVVADPIRVKGELIGFANITRDITVQHESMLASLEVEHRFRLLVQGVTDYAIFMLDPDGVVANWNPGAERIKGFTAEDIVGQHFSRLYLPEDVAARKPWKALETAAREGRFVSEGWRLRKDGQCFWAHVVIDAIRDDDGVLIGFAKVTRDLTERREVELALQRSQEALFQAQKMEAVGQLTGGLAHDFNNLLTGITGSLSLMSVRVAQGRFDDLSRYIVAAQGAASRAASLTHRLLAFSRQQTLEPKSVDANALILGMGDLVQHTVGPSIAIETIPAEGLWSCLCDPHQLDSAILNLCINARDAMPEGGNISIETANIEIGEADSRDGELGPGQYVVISVTDTGCGMPPEVLARAFDPFFTTKQADKGTGLGLSMIYGFAKQSGGEVRLQSEVGRGVKAQIVLPRSDEPADTDTETFAGDSFVHPGAGETVLVVDDEPTVRMLVAETINDLGYRALEAADAAEGLKVLQSDTEITLLITDVGLPGAMNGTKMADIARATRPDLKILFITGYAQNTALINGRLAPGMHVMSKPFPMDVLAARIGAIVGAP